jgi:hypothetical protein
MIFPIKLGEIKCNKNYKKRRLNENSMEKHKRKLNYCTFCCILSKNKEYAIKNAYFLILFMFFMKRVCGLFCGLCGDTVFYPIRPYGQIR